ncbi:MAG: orotidine-5'-phosphate decarboxylase [Puniceicoccaceae bacterium]|nr:orotidine-5'-phosphate decarboxylase [Puniceicoccaceae bacterium]
MTNQKDCGLILALDMETREEALEILDHLGDSIEWVKIGLQLFTAYGPDFVREIAERNYRIFLDLKLHDIPNTVAKAVRSIAQLPVELLSLHAAGGPEMIEWANQVRLEHSQQLRLLAVTVLTSMSSEQLQALNVKVSAEEQVLHLAKKSLEAGAQGLVCSPLELPALRDQFGSDPLIVTPGIRPQGSDINEQKRVMTPSAAAQAGSNYIVVGRPILQANNPALAAINIRAELKF